MEEAEGNEISFQPGQRVRAIVRGHQQWGLSVEIAGRAGSRASIDYLDIAGPNRGQPRPEDFPVGAEIDAVVRKHLGDGPPRWLYLMIPDTPS